MTRLIQSADHGYQVYFRKSYFSIVECCKISLQNGKERWLGPATVVFQEGKVVFVRHGGIFVRVSPNRIERVNEILKL